MIQLTGLVADLDSFPQVQGDTRSAGPFWPETGY